MDSKVHPPLFVGRSAANDIVLIILWIIATRVNLNYMSMVICFLIFRVNDVYGFIEWSKIKKRQQEI
jgi:hypothetical protein